VKLEEGVDRACTSVTTACGGSQGAVLRISEGSSLILE
jgi:hypothetical protein